MTTPVPIAGCYSVSCMDPRERIVEARFAKLMHLIDEVRNGSITGDIAQQIQELGSRYGSSRIGLAVNFYRNARAGGGWSLDSRVDLQTIKDNGLPVIAVYSTRHSQCAAIKVKSHLYDSDIAVMMVEDFAAVGISQPLVYRAHLEVVSKHEEFEPRPMDLTALVAHAITHGTSKNFPGASYDPENAAYILGIGHFSRTQMTKLASQANINGKGLLVPTVDLPESQVH